MDTVHIIKAQLGRVLCAVMLMLSLPAHSVERITYYHNDHLGSPVAATDTQGNVVWRESYQPYGTRDQHQGDSQNSLWFTGKQEDSLLGVSYFGARWYDPEMGRFLAMDPVGVSVGNPHSFNRYAYANNNPYRFVDPDGRALAMLGDWENATPEEKIQKGKELQAQFEPVGRLVAPPVEGLIDSYENNEWGKFSFYVGMTLLPEAGRAAGGFDALQAILHIKSMRGNFNIGSMTRSQMDEVGISWVGPNSSAMIKNGEQIGWVSADGLKTYRVPQLKENGIAKGNEPVEKPV